MGQRKRPWRVRAGRGMAARAGLGLGGRSGGGVGEEEAACREVVGKKGEEREPWVLPTQLGAEL